jgi:hypothetical protein
MTMNERGMTRAQLKTGSGKGADVADEHFHEMVGSRDFYIYVTPHIKPKGYESLKAFLVNEGCQVDVSDEAPMLPAKDYKAVKVTAGGKIIADNVLKRAHRWAHQRNYLHSFFKPLNGV